MLIEFRVENHRSLRDEQVLTFEADPSLGEDSRVRHVPGYDKGLLTSVGIYGANASGKSNVLDALAFMRHAVLDSHRFWTPEGRIPRDAFAWGERSGEPSLYQVTMRIEAVTLEYGFVVDNYRILEEWLHRRNGDASTMLFERDEMRFVFGDGLEGENVVISGLTRPNSLFVSAGAQSHHPELTKLFVWFGNLILENVGRMDVVAYPGELQHIWSRIGSIGSEQLNLFDLPGMDGELTHISLRDQVRDFLQASDLGVKDFRLEDAPGRRGKTYQRVFLLHQSEEGAAWLPLEQESHGTQVAFFLAPKVITTLHMGGILIIDELESGLHPLISRWVIEKFSNPKTNPNDAQLLFSTHDTNLLSAVGGVSLRRDQIWLTEKDRNGVSVLYPLTDFVPRNSENHELGYLQGRYGAVPMLGRILGEDH